MNFRRFGQYICAVSLVAAMSVTTMGATTISDVKSSHWAYAAITDLEERGIMVLTSSGQFNPNQTMNYFEVADTLAKATGYVDVEIATGITDTFKQQVKTNYEKQKATLQAYAKKYSTWNSSYNQQIAYLLGRGYMTTSDLDKFITKTEKGETKNIITKEDLCIYIVRMLGKEKTATSQFKTTTFKDDHTLKAANKPYVAYLASVGIVNPDTNGKANGTMKVTKALCAKMVSDALKINDTTQVGKLPSSTNGSSTTETAPSNTSGTYKVGKVLTKNTAEYYVLLENAEGTQSYYSMKNTIKVMDEQGAEIPITKLVGTAVNVVLEVQGNTQYITSIKVVDASHTSSGTQTNGTNPPTSTNTQDTLAGTTTVSGTLTSGISNEIVRVLLSDGTSKVYLVSGDCKATLNGAAITTTDALKAGDTVILTLKNSAVIQIAATSGTGSSTIGGTTTDTGMVSTLTSGEILTKKRSGTNYVFTVKQGTTQQQISIPTTAKATRNGRSISLSDLRVGDMVQLTRVDGVVNTITATGEKTKVEGTIKAIHIGAVSEIIVNVKNEDITYTVASDTEIYDNNVGDYINMRGLHLGQEVTIVLESKEAVSIDVDKTTSHYKLMGTITDIGKNSNYIEVLVDYDYVTGESKVIKRIETPSSLVVSINGKNKGRSVLEEDMDIVIHYKYLDDTVPEKILVL